MSGTSKTPKIMTWGFCGPYTSAKRSLTARAHHSHASGQQGARSFTHLQAPERGQSVCVAHMDQTRGLDALDRQAASSKQFQPSCPATGSRHAPKATPTHIPFRLRTFCNHCMCWCDRRSQGITPLQCTMLALSSCHASTRGTTRLTKLPRQAADGLA